MTMALEHLLMDLKDYAPDHISRVVHDLILRHATGSNLADVIEAAWNAGYEAKTEEDRFTVARPAPKDPLEEYTARAIFATSRFNDPDMRRVDWNWDEDGAWWVPEGFDTCIRPGKGGIVVFEAAGEYAGTVINASGEQVYFGEGTFR